MINKQESPEEAVSYFMLITFLVGCICMALQMLVYGTNKANANEMMGLSFVLNTAYTNIKNALK